MATAIYWGALVSAVFITFRGLKQLARILAKISALLAFLGLVMLMLAAMIGGSFHLSPSHVL